MDELKGLRVIVAGAGAVGSVAALALLRRGADVVLADPAALGDNASGVAAGMLAPAFEALLDPVSVDHFPLLAEARDAWTGLADSLDLPSGAFDRSGALLFASDETDLRAKAERMAAFGAACEILSSDQAVSLSPGLAAPGPALFTACDWRLEPDAVLAALQAAFVREGGHWLQDVVAGWSDNRARLQAGGEATADVLVLATGVVRPPWAASTELGRIEPIKGQIVRWSGQGPASGPVVRAPGIYVAPSYRGAVAGATMEVGRDDRTIDATAVEGLRLSAMRLFPHLAPAPYNSAAGVRASTPDGLPLVGPSGEERTVLAVGARRNGWLLAPAMADAILGRLRGEPPGAFAVAFDPARFATR